MDCGAVGPDELVRDGPTLEVIIGNTSRVNPRNQRLPALIDTGAEWNLIEDTLARGALLLQPVEDQLIQTANGPVVAPIYIARLMVPSLMYSKLHRFIGVNLGADRVLLGREGLQDFVLNYSGKSGRVTLQF